MPVESKQTAPKAEGQTPEPQGANITELETKARDKARSEIKARNAEVSAIFKAHLGKDGVQALYHDVLADTEIDPAAASRKLLEHLGKDIEPMTPAGVSPDARILAGTDELDKRKAGVTAALMVRAGVATPEIRASVDGSNPWRGSRLLDLATQSAERAGVSTRGMMPMEIVAAAFTQSTSDFPILLENVMHKTLQSAYAVAPDTWSRFCAIGSVSDFRDHNRYRVGSLGNLDIVNELGEFQNKAIPDGEKASINVKTRGNIINMSRQMVINDDLGAFLGASAMMGRAARRTIEQTVYNLIGENTGLGPTQADSEPLFHANRKNVGAAAVSSTGQWDAMRVIMAQQMDVSGNDYLDLRPAIWLGPVGLSGLAREVNAAEYNDDATKNQRKPNISRGLVRDIVDSPRLSGTRYYLLADPAEAPVFEVAFLDGVQEPYLERQDGFDVDGSRFKVRLDFGVAAVDYRGAVYSAGA
jgi:hypothetical protein